MDVDSTYAGHKPVLTAGEWLGSFKVDSDLQAKFRESKRTDT